VPVIPHESLGPPNTGATPRNLNLAAELLTGVKALETTVLFPLCLLEIPCASLHLCCGQAQTGYLSA